MTDTGPKMLTRKDVKESERWTIHYGPWQKESDRFEFEAYGLNCLGVRNLLMGHWCGYVGVPPGHPAYDKNYNDLDLRVHGGLTYASECHGEVCHIPKPGEPETLYWLGFDCAHLGDISPSILGYHFSTPPFEEVYRDIEYVKDQCTKLAKQLSEMTV